MPPLKMSLSTVKALFSKPATHRYPDVPREYYSITRGHIQIEREKCTLCLVCDKRCPTDAIKVDRTGKTWSIDRLACIQCNECVTACPKKCLSMAVPYSPAQTEKAIFTVDVPYTPPAPKPAAPVAAATQPST